MEMSRKGVGTLIASAFMVLILLLGFSVFFLMRTGAEQYQRTTEAINRLDWERSQEEAEIVGYEWPSNNLNVTVENMGSTEIALLEIGVFDKASGLPLDNTYMPIREEDALVNPGETRKIGPYSFLNQGENYTVQLVTKRGNMFSQEYPLPKEDWEDWVGLEGEIAGMFKHMGYASVHFEVRKFVYSSTVVSDDDPQPAWVVDKDDGIEIIFWIELTNHAVMPQNITLMNYSNLELVYYEQGSITSEVWYIVDNDSTVGNLIRYDQDSNPVTLTYNVEDYLEGGPPVFVKFGSSKCADKDGSPQDPDKQSLSKKGTFQLFLDGSIYFTINNYGKTEVTIAAVYVEGEYVEPQFLDGDATLKVYETTWIKVDVSETSSYQIVVSSTRGNTIEFEFEGL